MSGIVKSKPLPFLYVVDQNLLDKFTKVCKKDAPYAYTIPQKFLPYVKRYTSRTYQQVELVDGTIINTREFKRRPHFYTSHITLEKGKWSDQMNFRLNFLEPAKNLSFDQIGYVLTGLTFQTDDTKKNLRVRILGAGDVVLDTTISIDKKIFENLHEIGTNIAYCIRRMSTGVCKGMWDETYFNLLVAPFRDDFLNALPVHRRKSLKDFCENLPSLPPASTNEPLLNSLLALVDKIGYFETTFDVKKYSAKADFNRLTKLAMWFEENNNDGGFSGDGFKNSLRGSELAVTNPNMYKHLKAYCIGYGVSQWQFNLNTKLNLLDLVIKFLHINPGDSILHCDWINVMRAVNMYQCGKIPMFDNAVAGHQLTKLNELSGDVMRKKSIRDIEDLSFNKVRIRHLYLSLIKPVLSKMVKEQKSKTTTGE